MTDPHRPHVDRILYDGPSRLSAWRAFAPAGFMTLGALLLLGALAACGAPSGSPAARRVAPTATLAPTATVTPEPTATPQPTATPAPPSPPAPILDVRPSSMSIVGHLDCTQNGAYICQAAVVSRSSNQTTLRWTSFTSIPGHVSFSPAAGTLSPGQTLIITITVPLGDCTAGLFYFRGPANTHTISWTC